MSISTDICYACDILKNFCRTYDLQWSREEDLQELFIRFFSTRCNIFWDQFGAIRDVALEDFERGVNHGVGTMVSVHDVNIGDIVTVEYSTQSQRYYQEYAGHNFTGKVIHRYDGNVLALCMNHGEYIVRSMSRYCPQEYNANVTLWEPVVASITDGMTQLMM